MPKSKLVVLSGAGMSAESGIPTFRAADGLWEQHRIEDVASPQGWARNPELVLQFYNLRRRQIRDAQPNAGHLALAQLQDVFDVIIITQNIDDLHERGGSTAVTHLHGEILKVRSSLREDLILPWTEDLNLGDCCELGSQLRPHIVWFGEQVPMMELACGLASQADLFLIVGTSLAVYPAASLINYAPPYIPKFIVDPSLPNLRGVPRLEAMATSAALGLPILAERWRAEYS